MFRAKHRSSSGAQKVYLQPLVYIRLWFPAAVIATTLEVIIPMFLIAQHVSSETSLIIRSSKSVFAASVHMFVVAGCSHSYDSNRKQQT
jgi:hypothetical protein